MMTEQTIRNFVRRAAMTLAVVMLTAATAWAQGVAYIDASGQEQTCDTYTTLSDETTWTGWYVVDGTVEISGRVTASGDAHLILKDGATLTIPKGITVTEGNSLTIYGQSGGTGQLTIASPDQDYAGIGAYVISSNNATNTGTITINGGTITVDGPSGTGSGGAAIGGVYWGNTGTITINGGTVTAAAHRYGAGIGSGASASSGGTITINGGIVNATSNGGAGIGGATGAVTPDIFIHGGNVTATSTGTGGHAGIGGGNHSSANVITITGGTVSATGRAAGIGGGTGTAYVSPGNCGIVTITGGTITATGGEGAPGIGGGKAYGPSAPGADGGTIIITGGNVTANGTYNSTYGGGYGIGHGYPGNSTNLTADIRLSWTGTGNSITAEGYKGAVTLEKPFAIDGEETILPAGEVADVSTLAGKTLVPPSNIYAITVEADPAEGGTVTGGSSGTYAEGTSFTFTATANPGYRFVNWTIDGINGGSETTYPFTVNGDFSAVVAHFERVYALSGTNVGFYVGYDEVTEAAEGETVTVSADADAIAALSPRQYFTGTYSTSDAVLTTGEYDATFTMPAKAVTVSAVLAAQTEATIDLTSATPQVIGEGLYGLLTALEGYAYYDDANDRNVIDLDRDGTADVQLTGGNTVTRLRELAANYRFTLRYDVASPYATALFKFTASDEAQEQPEIEPLFDEYDNETTLAAWAADGKTRSVMLDGRTLYKDGKWNTLCLPFSVTISGSALDGDNVDVRTLASSGFNSSNGTLTLTFTDKGTVTEIEAGKPYIIKWDESGDDLTSPVFSGVTVPAGYTDADAIATALTTASSQTQYVDFIGTFSPVGIYENGTDKHNLFLGEANTLYYPTAMGYKVNSCRAYFQLKNGLTAGEPSSNAPVRAFNLNFGDEETGIITIDGRESGSSNSAVYTLDGRKVAADFLSGESGQVRADKQSPYTLPKGVYIVGGKKIVIK